MPSHELFDGRLQIYKRPGGRYWQCAARVGKKRFRETTHQEHLELAKEVAEDWYLDLRGKLRRGEIEEDQGPSFQRGADQFLREVAALASTSRSPLYVEYVKHKLERHILPFFGKLKLTAINRGKVQEYRIRRHEESIERRGVPPARSTMLAEISVIRQILKTAEGHGWIPFVPNLSLPYLTLGKKVRRAWFTPEEYQQLYKATERRITEGGRPGWKRYYEEMHDFVLIMANTGLRPDEAWGLEFRDVQVEDDYATGKTILVIDVRGKTGVGYCKSMPGAVFPFQRLRCRREREGEVKPTDLVFGRFKRHMFNKILEEEGLRVDRDGQRRTAYSLRHTYICMRLMEGANIHQIANNCRTSVQMIEEHYAAHIKDRLDTAAINVERPKAQRRKAKSAQPKA